MKRKVLFDMETNDFDDYLTLCLLAGTEQVDLVGVTINPGTPEQVGLVKQTLRELGRTDVVVGASNVKNHGNSHIISPIHYRVLGEFGAEYADGYAEQIIHSLNTEHGENLYVLTGAYLSNIAAYLKKYTKGILHNMFIQGGFAGANIVAKEDVLEKFKGQEAIKTFNFNCDIPSARYVLESDRVLNRHLVSKNVCHGTNYAQELHQELKHVTRSVPLDRVYQGMDKYLEKKSGKMLHDPLMALTFLNPAICKFVPVEMKENQGVWSAHVTKNNHTHIAVKCDYTQFYADLKSFK